jgi:hypothetical protein
MTFCTPVSHRAFRKGRVFERFGRGPTTKATVPVKTAGRLGDPATTPMPPPPFVRCSRRRRGRSRTGKSQLAGSCGLHCLLLGLFFPTRQAGLVLRREFRDFGGLLARGRRRVFRTDGSDAAGDLADDVAHRFRGGFEEALLPTLFFGSVLFSQGDQYSTASGASHARSGGGFKQGKSSRFRIASPPPTPPASRRPRRRARTVVSCCAAAAP